MNLPLVIFDWIKKQFKTHKTRAVLVSSATVVLITGGILWASGVFSSKGPDENFTYLPNRAFILADKEQAEPETLADLLHADEPDLETLLRKPAIAQELVQAETITDIVDSRLALNNLRSLDQQLTDRLAETPTSFEVLDLAELRAFAGIALAGNRTGQEHPAMLSSLPMLQSTGREATANPDTPGMIQTRAQAQTDALTQAKSATSRLLAAPVYGDLVTIPASINIKSVWQDPGEGLIHLLPSGEWVPEQGYKLYRIVNGESTLIAEQLGAPGAGLSGSLQFSGAVSIKELYEQATLTPEKLTKMGMNAAEFDAFAYRTDSLKAKPRVGGELDFQKMREALITIPSDMEQRIPETDLLLRQPIYILGRQSNEVHTSAAIKTSIWQKFSVIQPKNSPILSSFKAEFKGETKAEMVQSVLAARQQIATLSFVDDEFAEDAGFLVRDDLTALNLADGTKITYQIETANGAKSSRNVTIGTETILSKPQGLMGYGLDGKVPLRWQQVTAPAEKAIISGYWIERKLDGEGEFKQINTEPVVISYLLDETDVFFESPVFHEDEVDNGRTATYRIRALDIFGRTSEYSDSISFPVEKVTPPNAPAIDPPDLATDAAASDAAKEAIAANQGKQGIVLPIYTDSPDTVRFTIYRAVAHGAQPYGPPEVLANFAYDNPLAGMSEEELYGDDGSETSVSGGGARVPDAVPEMESATKNSARHLMRTNFTKSYPNLVYFDANVAEGYTYKYWVSAWDSWNNESAWSKSASAGVPSDIEPAMPGPLSISMLSRELPDFSQEPPGIIADELITMNDIAAAAAASGPVRSYTTDVQTIQAADEEGVTIGQYKTTSPKFSVIDMQYDNLPEDKYIHLFVAVRGEDVLPDGTARISWPAYSGDGLAGYAVYFPEFALSPLEDMQQMTRNELMELGRWRRLNDDVLEANQFVASGLNGSAGSFSLFLICLEPEAAPTVQPPSGDSDSPITVGEIKSHFSLMAEGGFVSIIWDAPDDPQIKFYRVYRSEVPTFKRPVDEAALVWTMVGDQIKAAKYTERVEQTFAHYYYYKVTSVTPWGVESPVGSVERFRVPATKPPQTPTLLLPLSRKDGIQINFSAVSHCDRYEIYRTEIPKVNEFQMKSFQAANQALVAALFDSPSQTDEFFSGMINKALKPQTSAITVKSPIRVIDKFKTLTPLNSANIAAKLNTVSDPVALKSYKQILDEFGPLAMSEYRNLSIEMLHLVGWTKVGEMPSDFDTVEAVDPATGLLKPLSIIDPTAVYGTMYLYTVQAWNDDNLGSGRPEPIEATTRRNVPFDPISGLKSDSLTGQPSMSWNAATMANLSWQQCRDDTVGYIVYRSDTEDGDYLQASPLLLETKWTDTDADRFAYNWYKVKVLDTGGYLSEFSEPLLIRRLYMTAMQSVIPLPERLPIETILPVITVKGKSFSIQAGTVFQITYGLTGTEPITVTVQATNQKGTSARGISLDPATRTLRTSKDMPVGTYTITLKAVNKAGESSVSFTLNVTARPTSTPKPTSKPTPTLTPRPTAKPTATPPPAAVAPTLKLEASSFSIYSSIFSAKYTLTGTAPITLKLQVYKADGSLASGFTINEADHTINASGLRPGQKYNGVFTATNSVGKSEVKFTLAVYLAVPVLATREDGYVFEVTHSTSLTARDFSVQLEATGKPTLVWSLQRITTRYYDYTDKTGKTFRIYVADVPAEVKIGKDGLLTVDRSIAAGRYAFDVLVSNDVGSDRQTIILDVKVSIIRFSVTDAIFLSSPDPADFCTQFLLSPDPTDNGMVFLSSASDTEATPAPSETPEPSATPLPVELERFQSDKVTCVGFTLSAVDVTRPVEEPSALVGRTGFAGTAMLDMGTSELVPVQIINADFDQVEGVDRMKRGTIYLAEPHVQAAIGVTLVSMDITPQIEKLVVSGYVQNPDDTLNLIGDLHTLEFADAKFRYGTIDILANLPDIRYQQLLIHDLDQVRIQLDREKTGNPDFLILSGALVTMKSHLETLSNEGLILTPTANLAFNLQGQLSGALQAKPDQTLQLLVPGGTALRVSEAALAYAYDAAEPSGHLVGKLVLPFEKAQVYTSFSGAQTKFAGEHPKTNNMDSLASTNSVTPALKTDLQKGLVRFGETVQQNGLHLVPNDPVLLDKCGYAEIDVPDWNGKGFMLDSAYMTPTSVADRGLSLDLQEKQAITVAPTEVTVDLDRLDFLPKEGGTQTPNETEKPFWVGMVMKGGTLTLPPAFIQTSDGKSIIFELAVGEMIYDLNGFNYQTYLYNPNGVPAQFGEELGSFEDVTVFDCMLDLYANRINLEINAEVVVDLFLQNRVKVKLYTNQEDNEDGERGQFLCSVAPTVIENGIAEGIDVTIDGGWLKPDGMHVNGALTIESEEVTAPDPLAFTDMIVPANKRTINGTNDQGELLAAAELDKPINVTFQGFTMEIRAIDLGYQYRAKEVPGTGSVWIVLKGSTLLSENIPLSSETTDNLIVECPNQLGLPLVIYEASQSVLTANFEGCVDVTGVLVPKLTEAGAAAKANRLKNVSLGPVYASSPVTSPGEGLVEFDTDALDLGFLGGLSTLSIEAVTRFGYDMNNSRCYFAVGLMPATEGGAINFGAGDVKEFAGMVVYNMVMNRDDQNHYVFPDDASQIPGFVDNLPVHTAPDSFFAAGIKGLLRISDFCEIRELYFGFGSGPVVDASGGLYLPLDVPGMIAGDGFKKVGSVAITYSHPERYFSFSMTIDDISVVVAKVGGSIGFEFSPHLFGVYIGYPETLAGNISIWRVGIGIGFRIDTEGGSLIKAKIEFGLEQDVEFLIVYLRGYLYAGADGAYYFDDGSGSGKFVLELYLKGGIEGGIVVGGSRYNIIGFYLDARGRLESRANDAWLLYCSCTVSYSLDLWLFSVEGSISASFDTTIG